MKFILFVVSICCLAACSSYEPPAHIPKKRLGDLISLGYKDSVYVSGQNFMVSFTGEQDNRCALRTTCIQAGSAEVELSLIHADGSEQLPLSIEGLCFEIDGQCSEPKIWNGYSFHLMQLSPYPGSNEAQMPGTKRVLELKVKKG